MDLATCIYLYSLVRLKLNADWNSSLDCGYTTTINATKIYKLNEIEWIIFVGFFAHRSWLSMPVSLLFVIFFMSIFHRYSWFYNILLHSTQRDTITTIKTTVILVFPAFNLF